MDFDLSFARTSAGGEPRTPASARSPSALVFALLAEGFGRPGLFEFPVLLALLLFGGGLVFVRRRDDRHRAGVHGRRLRVSLALQITVLVLRAAGSVVVVRTRDRVRLVLTLSV